MSYVLGVVGSPRRNGNTHVLVREAVRAAAEAGADTETIFLADLDISECNGCHACWRTGVCAQDDDMAKLYPRLAESDAVILGTPVYWYGPTALMKGFIDRLVYFNSPRTRPLIRGTKAAIVVPFEERDPQTAAPVEMFFTKCLQYLEMDFVSRLIVPGVTRKGEVAELPDAMRRAAEIGRTFASS